MEKEIENIAKQVEQIVVDENGEPLSKKGLKKLEKEREKQKRKEEVAARLAAEKAEREAKDVDFATENYGKRALNQSQERTNEQRIDIRKIDESLVGSSIILRARVQTSRLAGAKNCFFVLRQSFYTVQGVVTIDSSSVSKQFLKFAGNIPPESIILVHGEVVKAPEPIKSCTVQSVELKIFKLFTLSESVDRLPFSIEDASRPEKYFKDAEASNAENEVEGSEKPKYVKVNLDTRLNNRVMDLRTTTNQAIFRLQSGISKIFRDFLTEREFVEIHTPKIMGAASEGGANVFKLNYFKTNAFLAQSPQLHKQMSVCAGFEKVFEIGPVFRAEDSNTHRHMTEFIGMDLEMAFEEHYHEVLDLFDDLFVTLFTKLSETYSKELEAVNQQYPFEPFKFLPKTLRLKFPEGIALLKENGIEVGELDDLSTENERILGRLVREKYDTDFFILDKFPLNIRPFYTMPDPNNKDYSNSYDFFMRGEEIMSGAQRIHDSEFLIQRAKECGVDPITIQPYIDAFKLGAPPHAGGGIGLERVVMLYLGLGNIRRTSLFPRDPRRLAP
ncbi:aspartyl-tRNA synthetase [Neoconidiobolus thromboides FSU 785]|nr:aspartyl-tRNA synthetase [Neoconidiobolus thromboides FSU 785]